MGCFVRGGKNGMGCFVRGDKNCMGCFVRGGKLMRDVLFGVAKNGMGCFVPGFFVLHSIKIAAMFAFTFRHVMLRDLRSSCFPSLVPCLKFTLCNVVVKAGTDVSLVF